jgi:hypothetical protein
VNGPCLSHFVPETGVGLDEEPYELCVGAGEAGRGTGRVGRNTGGRLYKGQRSNLTIPIINGVLTKDLKPTVAYARGGRGRAAGPIDCGETLDPGRREEGYVG